MTRNTIIKYIRSARSRNRLTICSTRQYWWHNDEISDPVGSQYNEEISDPVLYHLWFDYERIPDEGFRRNVVIPMIWLWAYTWWRVSQKRWNSNDLTMSVYLMKGFAETLEFQWFDYERIPDEGFRRNVGIPMIWLWAYYLMKGFAETLEFQWFDYERIPDEGFRRNVGIPMIWLWAYTWWRVSQKRWNSNDLTMSVYLMKGFAETLVFQSFNYAQNGRMLL